MRRGGERKKDDKKKEESKNSQALSSNESALRLGVFLLDLMSFDAWRKNES